MRLCTPAIVRVATSVIASELDFGVHLLHSALLAMGRLYLLIACNLCLLAAQGGAPVRGAGTRARQGGAADVRRSQPVLCLCQHLLWAAPDDTVCLSAGAHILARTAPAVQVVVTDRNL